MEMSLVPFEPCSSFIISGASGSGKTQLVYKFLRHLQYMFRGHPPSKVLYCYGIYQPLFDEITRVLPNLEFHHGLPSTVDIEELTKERIPTLIILDDLAHQVLQSPEMVLIFTQGCHHRNLSVFFLTQNLFQSGRFARDITLNTNYIILFRNLRDASQIGHLARQLFPGKNKILQEIYNDCTSQPYTYMIVDISPHSDDKLRLRTQIFPGEEPIIYQL